ncbi:MAG: malonyl-ACP O-methyltransferase BioC [Methylococcaceae bacterium]|nr:malonyl-ACP O-methyltransferase BioC [Methylococcaceae bacterium]MCI0734167.1 malonyl-ACP O-methyltransferase BioC [Methylococcaceae bacterium]
MLDRCIREAGLDKALIRASFARAASRYDEWAMLQRRVGDRLLQFLSLDSASSAAILDLGAGTGYCSRRLNRPHVFVIDLDLAPAMLVEARSLDERKTHYVCGDAEFLPFRERYFDLVFSNLVIQWCGDLQRVFAEVHRILKPGGIFLFSTFGPETLRELRDAWRRVDFGTHVNEFSGGPAIRAAVSGAGLENQGIERDLIHIEYDDVLELMRELKGIGAHNVAADRPRSLTGKGKIGRMIAEYRNGNPDQKISATFELIVGRCRRYRGPNVGS